MADLHNLGIEFADWQADRERVSAQEATGDYPPASDWQNSDDAAVGLLEAYAAATAPIHDAAVSVSGAFAADTWMSVGPALTCSESDALADLFDALGLIHHARALRELHAAGDEPGDTHYQENA